MLNEIKTLLNIEVKLEEQKLENGTVVSAEAFEKGKEIFIVTDDEKVAMPVGEYILEDGRLLVVEAEGLIADVREVSDEVPAKEEVEETEDLEEEKKEEMSYATKEELAEVINSTEFKEPICPVYQNVNAQPVKNPEIIKQNLISQLTAPVRWTQIVKNMLSDGASVFTEMGPGKTLQGLVKKVDRQIETIGVQLLR